MCSEKNWIIKIYLWNFLVYFQAFYYFELYIYTMAVFLCESGLIIMYV